MNTLHFQSWIAINFRLREQWKIGRTYIPRRQFILCLLIDISAEWVGKTAIRGIWWSFPSIRNVFRKLIALSFIIQSILNVIYDRQTEEMPFLWCVRLSHFRNKIIAAGNFGTEWPFSPFNKLIHGENIWRRSTGKYQITLSIKYIEFLHMPSMWVVGLLSHSTRWMKCVKHISKGYAFAIFACVACVRCTTYIDTHVRTPLI